MDSKLVIVMLVSIVMGSAIGYGIGYSVLNPQIVILDHNLRVLSNEFSSLNSTVNEIEARKWNLVMSVSNTTNYWRWISRSYSIQGEKMKIGWRWDTGNEGSGNPYIQIGVHFSNGTLYDVAGSSGGAFSAIEKEITVLHAGNYFFIITSLNAVGIEGWVVNVWDYY